MKVNVVILLLSIVFALLTAGCATFKEINDNPPKPQTFGQTLIVAAGEIKALRHQAGFVVQASGQDCIKRPNTDICTAAREIDVKTKEFLTQLDQIKAAYDLAGGDLLKCSITIGNAVLPCEDQEDQIISGLQKLQLLLPKGDTK